MASAVVSAGDVMNASAALLNDVARTKFGRYTVQVPYLNIALDELQEYFEQNNVPVTDQTSAVINCPAGTIIVPFPPDPPIALTPYLPTDLVEIQKVWQRTENIDPYIPCNRLDGQPLGLAGIETSQFYGYVWEAQAMKFLPANIDIDLKLEYVRQIFTPVEDEDSDINVVNCKSYLENRTAALVAEFVEENPARAEKLNAAAGIALDRSLGISTKGRQGMVTRRMPFRARFKRRGSR
jgi:hypothetical protein